MTNEIKKHGGARPGAGRPPGKPAKLKTPATDAPLVFLQRVMNDPDADSRLRVTAASAALPYIHARKGDAGKKAAKQEASKRAGLGIFAPSAPPRLVHGNR